MEEKKESKQNKKAIAEKVFRAIVVVGGGMVAFRALEKEYIIDPELPALFAGIGICTTINFFYESIKACIKNVMEDEPTVYK